MTKYCLFSCVLACIALLALGVSCDHLGQTFKTDTGDESVSPATQASGEIGIGGPPVSDTRVVDEEPRSNHGAAARHVVLKPVSSTAQDVVVKPESPPPLEVQAVELAAKELAVNLRLLEEEDADKRAELGREMVSLREQRRSLYQTHLEGK
jgi:hypothetical protein